MALLSCGTAHCCRRGEPQTPGQYAIAHHLISTWAERGFSFQGAQVRQQQQASYRPHVRCPVLAISTTLSRSLPVLGLCVVQGLVQLPPGGLELPPPPLPPGYSSSSKAAEIIRSVE